MHEIFLPRHNKPEFAYRIFNHHSMFLRASRLAQKIDKLLWIHVLHKINDMFRYWIFFLFLCFSQRQMQLAFLFESLFVSAYESFVLLILFSHGP